MSESRQFVGRFGGAGCLGAALLVVIVGSLAVHFDRTAPDMRTSKVVASKIDRVEKGIAPVLIGRSLIAMSTQTTRRYLVAEDGTITDSGEQLWGRTRMGDRIKARWRNPD